MNYQTIAESVVDRTIRNFSPSEPGSFEKWDAFLEQAEVTLRKAGSAADSDDLSLVCSERIRIAFESRHFARVAERSREFVEEFSPKSPSFSNVVSTLVLALQEQEESSGAIEEIEAFANLAELSGSELIWLLALLPEDVGRIPTEEALQAKLEKAIVELSSEPFPSLSSVDISGLPLGGAARKLAKEIARWNLELAQAVLGD